MRALIRTFTGQSIDLLDPDPSAITIEDIAHGLAQTCRFSGQCPRFYSVAEHAIRVSYMVPEREGLAALLHDASEAYLSDLVSPVKALGGLSGYRALEARLMDVIYQRFGVVVPFGVVIPETVQRADAEIVELECATFFDGLDLLDLECLAPGMAEARFLRRFSDLTTPRRALSPDAIEVAARRFVLEGQVPLDTLDLGTFKLFTTLRDTLGLSDTEGS
jgi:hypothetical protein